MILSKDLLLDMPFNFICILFMIFLISKYAIENNLLRVYYENTLIHNIIQEVYFSSVINLNHQRLIVSIG